MNKSQSGNREAKKPEREAPKAPKAPAANPSQAPAPMAAASSQKKK